jgi:hypothetical protein
MTAAGAARRWTDGTLRHSGYVISQQKCKRVEEIFGWIETIANFRARPRTHPVGGPPGGRRIQSDTHREAERGDRMPSCAAKPPAEPKGGHRDNHSSRYHLSCSVAPLPAAPRCEFSAPETEDSSPSLKMIVHFRKLTIETGFSTAC